MTESGQQSDIAKITDLLTCYSFDLDSYTAGHLVEEWLSQYSIVWVRLAIIEALYQGRYKAVSVQQILMLWQRRGQPIHHFNAEFERIVSSSIPRSLTPYETPPATPSIARRPSYDPQLRDRLEKLRSPMNRVPGSTPSLSSEQIPASAPPEISTIQEPQGPDPAIAVQTDAPNDLPDLPNVPNQKPDSQDSIEEPTAERSSETPTDLPPDLSPDLSPELSTAASSPAELPETGLSEAELPEAESSPVGQPTAPESLTTVSLVLPDPDPPPVILPRSLPQPAQLGSMPIIQQFTPSSRTSRFYARLRAVVGDRPPSEDSSPEA